MFVLYHNGHFYKSYKVWADQVAREEYRLRQHGYTYGYTKEEVEKAKQRYEEMLKDIIECE